MKIDKKAISYYHSFFEVSKDLTQKQFYDFNMAIYKVMFFETHIDEVLFNDSMLTILWKSVKHSIKASIDGYCTKKSIPYDSLFLPLSKPLDNKDNEQGEEKGEEKEQGQIVRVTKQDSFTFYLKTQKLLSTTSKIYQQELKVYINNSGKNMSYQDFYNQCEMKPYKYKNFKMAYDSWNKDNKLKSHQQPISFQEQERQRVDNIADVVLNQGINPFDPKNYEQQEEITDVQLTH